MEKIFQTLWLPLTPRGVAITANASWRRLFALQFIVALIAAMVVVWFVRVNWFPMIREAIAQCPAQGEIRRGELRWRGDTPIQLSANRFLALGVDSWHEARMGGASDVSVEFGRRDVRISSVLGFVASDYPMDYVIGANRDELEPWWGAWQPWISLGLGAGTFLGLLLVWALLAIVYWLPAWLVAFFANRALNFSDAWKLASASLIPGALLFTLAIVAYGIGWLDLIRLGLSAACHIVIGWIYVFTAPIFLQRVDAAVKKGNPFASESKK